MKTIEYQGIKLTLDQGAYITGSHGKFEAKAHDEKNNLYMITWNPMVTWCPKAEEHINANSAEAKMTIEYEGIKLTLEQDPYMGSDKPYFEAKAHDEKDGHYMVTWYPMITWQPSNK